MPKITRDQVKVPADVLADVRETYVDNYMKATRGTGRLMLFACDQKVEHLNKDFYGEGIDIADAEPEHLFKIGDQGVCGVLAGQRGLIAQYAADYPNINYLVKMNSKTNLVKTAQEDPYSPQLYDLEAVLAMRDNGVNIVGLGYTIYLGSEYESTMLAEAGVNVDMIVQASASTGTADISFTVPGTAAAKVQEVLQEKQGELGFQSFDVDPNVGKVAVVGVGMKTHSGLAAKFFNALSDKGVNVLMISTSEIRIAALVPLEQLNDAVKALHTAYGLDADQVEAVVYGGTGR